MNGRLIHLDAFRMSTSKYHLKRKGDNYEQYVQRVEKLKNSRGFVIKLKPSDIPQSPKELRDPMECCMDAMLSYELPESHWNSVKWMYSFDLSPRLKRKRAAQQQPNSRKQQL